MVLLILIGAAGALAGALGLSILTVLLYSLLEPRALHDGQFVMVFILTIPFGALLGGVSGLVIRQIRRGYRVRAGWLAAASGAAVFACAVLIAWASADSRGGGTGAFLETLFSLWIAPSWVAAGALVVWGTRLVSTDARARGSVATGPRP